jgi:hypothetical protein
MLSVADENRFGKINQSALTCGARTLGIGSGSRVDRIALEARHPRAW